MRFVGAMPHWGATAGEDLFAIYFAPSTTSLEFTTPTGEYIVLNIATAKVTNFDDLVTWFDSRSVPTDVGGVNGWSTLFDDGALINWTADGRLFQLAAGDLPLDSVLALATSVRPATKSEWAAIAG